MLPIALPLPNSLTARLALDAVGSGRRTGQLLRHLEPCCNYAVEVIVEADALANVGKKVDAEIFKAVADCVASTYIHVLYFDIQERCPSDLSDEMALVRSMELDKATRVRLQNLIEAARAQKRFSWGALSNDHKAQALEIQHVFHRLARETGAMQLGESMTEAIQRLETTMHNLPPVLRQPPPFLPPGASYLSAPLVNSAPREPSPTRFSFPDASVSYVPESYDGGLRATQPIPNQMGNATQGYEQEPIPDVVILEYQPSVRPQQKEATFSQTDAQPDFPTDSPSGRKDAHSKKSHLSAPRLKTSCSSLRSVTSTSSKSSHSRPHTPTLDTGYHQYPYDAYHSHCHGGYPAPGAHTAAPGAALPYDLGHNMSNVCMKLADAASLGNSTHGNAFINVGNDNSRIIYNYEGKKKRRGEVS